MEIIDFIESGRYRCMKESQSLKAIIRDTIKSRLVAGGSKRVEYPAYGLVAKFVVRCEYEINREGLNDYLYDLGLLPYVARIDASLLTDTEKERLADFEQVRPLYVRFSPVKAERTKREEMDGHMSWLENMSMDKLLQSFILHRDEHRFLETQWERLRFETIGSLHQIEGNKLVLSRGILSLSSMPSMYSASTLLEVLGPDPLLRCSKVDMSKLDEYMALGFIQKAEIESYRRVVDVHLQFSLIDLEAETRVMQAMHQRLQRLNSIFLENQSRLLSWS